MGIFHLANAHGRSFSNVVAIDTVEGRWVFVAGQLGVAADGDVIEFEAETRSCLSRVDTALGRCGASLRNVVRMDVFLTDLAQYEVFSRVRGELFRINPPSSTAVQVAGLLRGARIEITVVAFCPPSGTMRQAGVVA